MIEKEIITDSGRIPLNPFAYGDKKEKDLVILLLSDIHLDHKKIEKLKGWHKDYNNDIIDYAFILGDFDNLFQDKNNIDLNECCQSEARITNLLNFLEFLSCPLLLIPGNHDPQTMFDAHKKSSELPRMTQHSFNIHKQAFQLNQTLSVVGFGGSIPGYQFPNGVKTKLWDGYPYDSEKELEDDANEFFKKQFENEPQKQFILMTHVGPYNSSTTIVKTESVSDQHVYSGSEYLDKLLQSYSQQVIVNVHGHTHDSHGRNNIYKVPVVNPGSLLDGNFCKINLHKDSASQKWVLRSSHFINLNSF
ncbi:ser/thr phosphatase family protein (macronuclear) [Tetrahymena thermophila SB210]|uniref:Ser/thr phosphatase family protein n=1 Tax=Tetrahymena thermophila (strain SB210) TaxID=312017 RepID=I7M2X3_TETTS|nr:ser/thr phosphatase family protein [Tetrahymena thermophila SB210]EAS01472.1 ser/thr phosphatase family protein [Tetrahymena thermophila SB210]|eukprot:XP_001021718.1 ser/thr phosphatase family protein [Tetrahymena thermophila SB210]